jgi:tRNA(Ile2) C34 agmatinyltransferase TiaS
MYIRGLLPTRSKIFYAAIHAESVLERSVVHKRAREPRYPFCPRCGMPWRNIGSRFVCPNCGYTKLTPAGRSEVEEKLLRALERLLDGAHGDTVAVTFRKLARAASLEDWETAHARARWRKILPTTRAVNGARWRYARDDGERVIYKRVFADVTTESVGW